MTGPLKGIRIVEINASGPVAMFGWIMADYGATVVRIDRPSHVAGKKDGVHVENRPVLELDFKDPASVAMVLDMVEHADVIVEGYRPGVMERLGMGPQACQARNPRLIYARCTGWGQEGPLAQEPGHDINYLALTGALAAIGPAERPVPPLNIGADYGGGAMPLALGVLAAIISARETGRGQVIDNAMIDGAGVIASILYELHNRGQWNVAREANMLDGAAPYYGIYRCADGKFVAVGALEMKFRAALADVLGLPELGEPSSSDPATWAALKARVAAVFATAPRDEWVARSSGRETCCTPVLDIIEAPQHAHNVARAGFVSTPGGPMPAPAPRLSGTPLSRVAPLPLDEALAAFGIKAAADRAHLG